MVNEKKTVPKGKKPAVPKPKAVQVESKTDKFNRIGKLRVEKVLKSLRILGNCANKSTYEYTIEQVNKMSRTLVKSLEATIVKFHDIKKEAEAFEF